MQQSIGFLGFGTMSSAIARGLIGSGYPSAKLAWYNPSERMERQAAELGMPKRAPTAEYLIAENDIIFLGMKPQQAPMSLLPLQGAFREGQVVVSMLAGLRIADLAQQLPDGVALVRIMPNTPVALGKGVIGVVLGDKLQPNQRAALRPVLECLGETLLIDEERMDALTSVSGSGPAFVFRLIEAFEHAAKEQGFEAEEARMMVRQTFAGALELLEDQGGDAAALRRAVTSKAGMTEAGLRVLDQSDPNGLMSRVLQATARRGDTLARGVDTLDLRQEAAALVRRAQPACRQAAELSDEEKTRAIGAMADALENAKSHILQRNLEDMSAGALSGLSDALMDRLLLDSERLAAVITDLRAVAVLPDPVGRVLDERRIEDGLLLRKVAVPIGVVAVIYESRPNVTVDAAGLCLRSGNAVILRGGKEARQTSMALVDAMRAGLQSGGFDANLVQLVSIQDRSFVGELLKHEEGIQLVVPRGGPGLIRAVSAQSRIPVVKHDKGLCSVYIHAAADIGMARRIVLNAKVQRPGVCNAIENLLIDAEIAATVLPLIGNDLSAHRVELRACPQALPFLPGALPARAADWDEEYLDLVLALKVVSGLDEAISFTQEHSSQHSDAIVTGDEFAARRYLSEVDSAAVYHNASTRFTDGKCFALGAEVGISTNRLHARGPMGLAELCTYKYQIFGDGQVRG
jgi:glutamate-5-semialdehyde dehydrogenase